MSEKLKVMTVIGTRPEIIRLARVMSELDRQFDHVIVHTGQNYDYELNEVFFNDLELRKPDYFLGVDTSSLGKVLGNILIEMEQVILKEKPDAFLVLGDTNSAVASLIAKRMKVPVYHMEAGNRCFDANVPEEINRKMVDHISDFNLVYTEHARRHLLSEGLDHRRIYHTGSPLKEVLDYYLANIKKSNILEKLSLQEKKYILVSLHREENVDQKDNLLRLLDSLEALYQEYKVPVIVSTHPRTRNRLDKLDGVTLNENIQFLKPFGFLDYNQLQLNAFCVISDSGSICEEASILGFPAITVRNAIERPEGLDVGAIIMTGLNKDIIVSSVAMVVEQHGLDRDGFIPESYRITNVSHRVVNLIMGTAKLSNMWDGIRQNDLS